MSPDLHRATRATRPPAPPVPPVPPAPTALAARTAAAAPPPPAWSPSLAPHRRHRGGHRGGHRGQRGHRARGGWVSQQRLPVGALQRADRHPGQPAAGQMTLDDKIAMVDGVGYANGTTGYVGHIAANPALCIPGLNLEDGPQGVADGVPGVTQLPAPVALAATLGPGAGPGLRLGGRQRGTRQGRRREPGPDREHRPRPALGPGLRELRRRPLPGRPDRGRVHRRGTEPGRHVPGQALRRLQPGDQPEHGGRRRHRQPACDAGDLPARSSRRRCSRPERPR